MCFFDMWIICIIIIYAIVRDSCIIYVYYININININIGHRTFRADQQGVVRA